MTLSEHKINLMRFIDGEMDDHERAEFEAHIEGCETCRGLLRDFSMMKEVTGNMRVADLPEKVWEKYWTGVYNKLERSVAWFFFVIGSLILTLYGVYEAVTEPGMDSIVRLGLILLLVGFAILLMSVVREKLTVNKSDRYISEVDR